MTIHLSPEQERLIDQAIQAGSYRNTDDLIASILEVLRAEDGFLHEMKDEIEQKIERALAQFERGESLSAEQSRAGTERCKTAWLRGQSR